jgi:ABC-type uncharacterized transport system permease subunit
LANVWLFVLLALACGQGAAIIAEGGLFAPVRALVQRFSPFLAQGISCRTCVATWAGLTLALSARFADVQPGVVAWFIDGLALALAGRTLSSLPDVFLAIRNRLE